MNGNGAIARILKREQTEYLFCFPANGVIEACAREGIRPIVARTERTLINMADGYSRVHNGRRFGVCAVQAGPGAENAFAGVAQAASESTPILILPGGTRRARRGVPYTFQAPENYRAITRWVDEVNQPERIPEMMRRAFSALRNGRRGPVMLEVPNDVGASEVDEAAVQAYVSPGAYRSMADPADVEAAAELLMRAALPVIHAGQGVHFAEAWAELRQLAERLSAPVMTTNNGKSAFPENHPLSLGTAGLTGTEACDTFLKRADVILGVGASFSSTAFSHPLPVGTRLIQLTTDERDLNKDYPIAIGLLGDAQLVLRQLIERIGPRAPIEREVAAVKQAWLERWRPRLTSDDEPISPYRVIYELGRTLDRANAIVTHDSGNPRDQLLPFYEALIPRGYLGWGKSTQLGYGYGLALGAKLAAPERVVVNVMGDTAFGMVGMDVETAVRERIGVLTVLLNNGAMGGYERAMPLASERYRVKFLGGEYAAVATGLGAYAERVVQVTEIAPALERAIEVTRSGRPAVLEIITREEPVFSQYFTPTY